MMIGKGYMERGHVRRTEMRYTMTQKCENVKHVLRMCG